jgi:hypothetical protein
MMLVEDPGQAQCSEELALLALFFRILCRNASDNTSSELDGLLLSCQSCLSLAAHEGLRPLETFAAESTPTQ